MALEQKQVKKIGKILTSLAEAIDELFHINVGTLLEDNKIDTPVGTVDSLKENHKTIKKLKSELTGLDGYSVTGGPDNFATQIPIELEHLKTGWSIASPSNSHLEDTWKNESFVIIEEFYNIANSLTSEAKLQLDTPTSSVFDEATAIDLADPGMVTAVENIANRCKQFINAFGAIGFSRKDIAPPPGPDSASEIIMIDKELETFLAKTITKGSDTATHYIGFLEPPGTSGGTRKSPYLPVRYAPHYHSPPLNNGWDDEGYLILNQNNKLVKPKGHFEENGIEIELGLGIHIVEYVLSNTGMWVGFVPAQVDHPSFVGFTKESTRALYTRPKYIRRLSEISEDGSGADPIINHTLISVDTPHNRASYIGSVDGTALVKPDSNLNWTGLKYGDVQLAYYNFNKHNDNAPDTPKLNSENIYTTSRLRLSEGYYYFVAVDGSRMTVAELLNVISIDPTGDPSTDPDIVEGKKDSAGDSVKLNISKALDMILEYNGKARPEGEGEWETLLEVWTILVAKHKIPHAPSNKNEKLLFAVPASIIEALPNTDLSYHEQFDENMSDFYQEFGEGGKNFIFTVKASEMQKTADDLVKVFTKIKGRLEEFKSSGGVIKNQNNINYNIDSQIEKIKKVPEIFAEFLKRQAPEQSPDRDYISVEMFKLGLAQEGEAFIQVGMRASKEIGQRARQTVSFVLFSPDPNAMKKKNKNELLFFDPYITNDELSGARDTNRSAIACKRALPWLRDKFIDVEGSRTLYYFFAHRNMIGFEETIKSDFSSNNWIKFLQAYTVPPLSIKLSADRGEDPEEIDCKKLIEKLEKSHSTIREDDKKLHEVIEKNCGEAYLKMMLKSTSASDPESSRSSLDSKQSLAKNANASGNSRTDWDTLSTLYDGFLHKLDINGIIALLIACLQKQLGMPLTAQAICEVAIEELVKQIGVDEMKKVMFRAMPELAIFFGDTTDYALAKIDAGDQAMAVIDELNGQPYTTQGASDQFIASFNEELVQNPAFQDAPIAVALAQRVLEGSPFAIGLPLDKTESIATAKKLGASTIDMVARLERRKISVPLEPFWVDPSAAWVGPVTETRRYTILEIGTQQKIYTDSGYSVAEARACLVRDGFLEVSPSFLLATLESPPDVGNMVTTGANAIADLGKTFLSVPPSPRENSGNTSWPSSTDVGKTLSKADEAKEFVAFLKNVIDLQQVCESIVGPMLQMPGMLFTRPGDFVNTWKNWWDNLTARLTKQFKWPGNTIPSMMMPSTLPTDDLIKDYADKLLAALASMIGMVLGEILNMILKDYLEKCLEEATDDNPESPSAGIPDPKTIPLPILGDIARSLPKSDLEPDYLAWLKDIIDYLSAAQLCALLQAEASELTVGQILERTKTNWSPVWNSGINNAADIKQIFTELGEKVDLRICDAIQATEPLLLDACEAQYDWDARCAELQMQGLTKEECDVQIQKELDDLRNKVRAMAGFLFPDSNPLDDILPHPCGPRGYFQLPSAMKHTMTKVTDNFLDGVKASMIRDLQGVKFMSVPPRAVELMNDHEELIETHREFNDAIKDKIEKLTLMPVETDLGYLVDVPGLPADPINQSAEKSKHNILTYTKTHGNAYPGYSRAGVEAFSQRQAWKAVPHEGKLDISGNTPTQGPVEKFKRDKPKSLLNVGHFNDSLHADPTNIYGSGPKIFNSVFSKSFVNSVYASGQGLSFGSKSDPWYPGRAYINHSLAPVSEYVGELRKLVPGGVDASGLNSQFPPNTQGSFPQIAEEINVIVRGDKKTIDGVPEQAPKGLHKKIVGYEDFKRLYTSREYYEHARNRGLGSWNPVTGAKNFRFVMPYLKYNKMYRLDQKLIDLMPPGTIWYPHVDGSKDPWEYLHFLGLGPRWKDSARPVFMQLFANFVGMAIDLRPPGQWSPHEKQIYSEHIINERIKTTREDEDLSKYFDKLSPPQRAAWEVIEANAPSDKWDWLSAFVNMPIELALGLDKDTLFGLYPRWWGLYESIKEEVECHLG